MKCSLFTVVLLLIVGSLQGQDPYVRFPDCSKEGDDVVVEKLQGCDEDIVYSFCEGCNGLEAMWLKVIVVVDQRPLSTRKLPLKEGEGTLNYLKEHLTTLAENGSLPKSFRIVVEFTNGDDRAQFVTLPLTAKGTGRLKKGVAEFKEGNYDLAYSILEKMDVKPEYIKRLKVQRALIEKDTTEFLKVYKPTTRLGVIPSEGELNPVEEYFAKEYPDFEITVSSMYVDACLGEAKSKLRVGKYSSAQGAANKILKSKNNYASLHPMHFAEALEVLMASLEETKSKKEIKAMGYLAKYFDRATATEKLLSYQKKYKF